MTQEFRSDPAWWPVMRNRMLVLVLAAFVIAVLIAVGAAVLAIPFGLDMHRMAAGVTTAIVLLIMVWTSLHSLRTEHRKYFSYTLTIDDTEMRQRCDGMADVNINRDDVQDILLTGHILRIRGGDRLISVPKYLLRHGDVMAALESVHPVRRGNNWLFLLRVYSFMLGLTVLLGLVIFALYALLIVLFFTVQVWIEIARDIF